MEFLNTNIRFLRKQKGLTQQALGKKIGVNRAMVGSYEEGRAVPKIAALQDLAYFFDTSIDELLNTDLSQNEPQHTIRGKNLRVLSTVIDPENRELITLVPQKAAAGYTKGYADPEFIESLPQFALPLPQLSQNHTYRAFQIEGDSMEPVPSGAYIIAEFLQDWQEIDSGNAYILVTKDEGIVYKRVYDRIKPEKQLLLKSDNPEYQSYTVGIEQVLDIWKAVGYISFSLPDPNDLSLSKLSATVMQMKTEIEKIKQER